VNALISAELRWLRGVFAFIGERQACLDLDVTPEELEAVALHGADPGLVERVRGKLATLQIPAEISPKLVRARCEATERLYSERAKAKARAS
jgi:hypothetical protein